MEEILRTNLREDIGCGDITTNILIGEDVRACGKVISKEDGIICGVSIVKTLFALVDKEMVFLQGVSDGERITKGKVILKLTGKAKTILTLERLALNLLQHLSGIATQTSRYVEKVKPYSVSIIDTRKTSPGLRNLEKYAVRCGGGKNHRFGLFDGILIKDNHVDIVGGVKQAVKIAREKAPHGLKIEVEVRNLEEVKEALEGKADIILLDNMDIEMLKKSVEIICGRAIVEASGGINLENVEEVAKTGVNLISVGALTHSVRALDLSMVIDLP
ncbi:MAG: carboxylating nicotinate-nucleotide diphosphorylase [bacterium]